MITLKKDTKKRDLRDFDQSEVLLANLCQVAG